MSAYQWSTVLICDADYQMIPAQRIVIGSCGVGPCYIDNAFTESEWSVDHVKTGLSLAFYTDFDVALNFARMIDREFGNIDAWAERRLSGQATAQDEMFNRIIHQRRQHDCYVDVSYFVDREEYNKKCGS